MSPMKRREFITLVGGLAAAWPFAARAQRADRIRRLGVLMALAENDAEGKKYIASFVQGLHDLGWTEGGNIRIEYRWAARMWTAFVALRSNSLILSQTRFWP
jgi:putative tryptophan/tyrosine transport system substrate-binding protein